MKITLAGNAILDVINEIDEYPKKGLLTNINNLSYSVGGAVSNTGITLKRLDKDLDVEVIGRIGDDQYGDIIINKYKENNLNINKMIIEESKNSSFTVVMSERGGQRTFFYYGDSNDRLSYDDLKIDELDCDIFHLGYALLLKWFEKENKEYGNEFAHVFHDVRKRGIKTSLDVVSSTANYFKDVVAPILPYLNYLIINETEAEMITNISPYKNNEIDIESLKKMAKKIKDLGVKDKVVIHSPKVSVCLSDDFSIVYSLKLPKDYIVGTTGAGDAFCAGALYGILHNYNDVDMLNLASSCAACNLSSVNSIDGARSLNETMKIYNKYKS